jgi:hypothetical protein
VGVEIPPNSVEDFFQQPSELEIWRGYFLASVAFFGSPH